MRHSHAAAYVNMPMLFTLDATPSTFFPIIFAQRAMLCYIFAHYAIAFHAVAAAIFAAMPRMRQQRSGRRWRRSSCPPSPRGEICTLREMSPKEVRRVKEGVRYMPMLMPPLLRSYYVTALYGVPRFAVFIMPCVDDVD